MYGNNAFDITHCGVGKSVVLPAQQHSGVENFLFLLLSWL